MFDKLAVYISILVGDSVVHVQGYFYKTDHLIGACLHFQRVLVYYNHGGAAQLGRGLEKVFLDPQTARRRMILNLAWGFETLKPSPSDTLPPTASHPFQQVHTSKSFPRSATP